MRVCMCACVCVCAFARVDAHLRPGRARVMRSSIIACVSLSALPTARVRASVCVCVCVCVCGVCVQWVCEVVLSAG